MAGAAASWRTLLLILSAALLAAGCGEGGTLTNHRQSCSSSSGLLSSERAGRCSGTVGSVRGSVGIEFGGGDDDEELFGTYRLTAVISVGEGAAGVYAYDAEGERITLGRL